MANKRYDPEFDSFVRWLASTPGADQLRFWQALLAWTATAYDARFHEVLAKFDTPEDKGFFAEDTFYWEWEGPHPIGPKRHVAE